MKTDWSLKTSGTVFCRRRELEPLDWDFRVTLHRPSAIDPLTRVHTKAHTRASMRCFRYFNTYPRYFDKIMLSLYFYKFPTCFWQIYLFFYILYVFFVSPYHYRDAFMHHTMHVLDAPGHTHTPTHTGLFCDGTRRYGVPAPFSQSKEQKLFVMYIITE